MGPVKQWPSQCGSDGCSQCTSTSVHRLASLWEAELRAKGGDASLCWVVWSFCQSRLLLSILCLAVTQLAGFSGPVSHNQSDQFDTSLRVRKLLKKTKQTTGHCSVLKAFVVRRLLEYTQQGESDLAYGLLLVLGLLTTELIRSWSLALTWALNYRTGSRLRGAVLSLAFDKILRLRSVRDQSLGQVGALAVFSLSLSSFWQCLSFTSRPPFCLHTPSWSICVPATASECLTQRWWGVFWQEAPWWPFWVLPTTCLCWDQRLCWDLLSSSSSTQPWSVPVVAT